MAQVRGLGPRVGSRLALFCIHRVNRVYGALVVTSWTCYGTLQIVLLLLLLLLLHVYDFVFASKTWPNQVFGFVDFGLSLSLAEPALPDMRLHAY